MMNKHITIDQALSLFNYDPQTGCIYWKALGKGRIKKREAGTQEKSGYRGILIYGKRIRSHILAWALYHKKWPKDQIDHINGVKTDNRIENLREATNSQNGKNLPIKSNNNSGCPGVCFDKTNKKWRATIKVDHKQISLGRFEDFEKAVSARKNAEIKYYGGWRHYK